VSRVFAYGTFRAGQSARAMIAVHVVSARPATARGRLVAFAEGYPGMLLDDTGTVVGELLELRDLAAALALLDAYEGEDYQRTMHEAKLGDGSSVWAWVYVLKEPSRGGRAVPVEDGDWVAWLARQPAH
jgi:gamma-glutamylcyclotransferase (GGCT)/AIG2-like uncharacterized protein YtfP